MFDWTKRFNSETVINTVVGDFLGEFNLDCDLNYLHRNIDDCANALFVDAENRGGFVNIGFAAELARENRLRYWDCVRESFGDLVASMSEDDGFPVAGHATMGEARDFMVSVVQDFLMVATSARMMENVSA